MSISYVDGIIIAVVSIVGFVLILCCAYGCYHFIFVNRGHICNAKNNNTRSVNANQNQDKINVKNENPENQNLNEDKNDNEHPEYNTSIPKQNEKHKQKRKKQNNKLQHNHHNDPNEHHRSNQNNGNKLPRSILNHKQSNRSASPSVETDASFDNQNMNDENDEKIPLKPNNNSNDMSKPSEVKQLKREPIVLSSVSQYPPLIAMPNSGQSLTTHDDFDLYAQYDDKNMNHIHAQNENGHANHMNLMSHSISSQQSLVFSNKPNQPNYYKYPSRKIHVCVDNQNKYNQQYYPSSRSLNTNPSLRYNSHMNHLHSSNNNHSVQHYHPPHSANQAHHYNSSLMFNNLDHDDKNTMDDHLTMSEFEDQEGYPSVTSGRTAPVHHNCNHMNYSCNTYDNPHDQSCIRCNNNNLPYFYCHNNNSSDNYDFVPQRSHSSPNILLHSDNVSVNDHDSLPFSPIPMKNSHNIPQHFAIDMNDVKNMKVSPNISPSLHVKEKRENINSSLGSVASSKHTAHTISQSHTSSENKNFAISMKDIQYNDQIVNIPDEKCNFRQRTTSSASSSSDNRNIFSDGSNDDINRAKAIRYVIHGPPRKPLPQLQLNHNENKDDKKKVISNIPVHHNTDNNNTLPSIEKRPLPPLPFTMQPGGSSDVFKHKTELSSIGEKQLFSIVSPMMTDGDDEDSVSDVFGEIDTKQNGD